MKTVTQDGIAVPRGSPARAIWCCGVCRFASDDYHKLVVADDVPQCPTCYGPIYSVRASEWRVGAVTKRERTNVARSELVRPNESR